MIGAVCSAGKPNSERENYLSAQHWQLTIDYRRQYSHRHFVGTQEQVIREGQGTEIKNHIHLADFNLTYQLNPRWSFNVSVPVMFASRTIPAQLFRLRGFPNAGDEIFDTAGIGDVIVSAKSWIFRPPTESGQNIALGVGIKFPTGNPGAKETVNTPTGPRALVADQSIQLGDRGYGVTASVEAFKTLKKATLYFSGIYLLNPRDTNGVLTGRSRPSEALMSVPDQYLAEAGVAYPFFKVRGVAANLAWRLEGIPVRDLIGASNGFRRPGYAVSLSPGFVYSRGRDSWAFNVPIALRRNRERSVPDILDNTSGDAAFADYLMMVSYSRRF